ncbi:MAG: M20/M25/M40 family metallo-hydrolase [Deltaproteobacteria bacterium]|nr:M20/M25/M40 family metallo-hydrolase [Deltaproteobacteria bacterium]
MNINSITQFIEKNWDESAIPALMEYVSIPAVSPFFARDWQETGYLRDALNLAKTFCQDMELENSSIQIIADKGRTPILLIEIDATSPDNKDTILLYGHLDKQPPAKGWDKNKGPFSPVIENNKLYGRGSADDGYCLFTAVTAIKALQALKIPHGRCVILIETCEESGSFDLEYYLEKYEQNIGTPNLIICLDSGCGDYDRLWITTSLRGAIVGELEACILTQSIHSGTSGIVASSFRILRQVLDRVEDSKTGELPVDELQGRIPEKRLEQINMAAQILDKTIASAIPLVDGAVTMSHDPVELLVNSTWKPTLSYIGVQGMPPVDKSANAIRESTKLMLSFRTPPNVETVVAAETLKTILENDPPYGARVKFKLLKHAKGWDMPEIDDGLETKINKAASMCFGNTPCYVGEGGSIPFMTLLADKFPQAKFLITGVLGPQSNAHGPNEFLHIPYAKKLTLVICCIISDSRQG